MEGVWSVCVCGGSSVECVECVCGGSVGCVCGGSVECGVCVWGQLLISMKLCIVVTVS